MLIAYCYTQPVATFADERIAKDFVERHVQSCRHGSIPEATWLWHLADDGTWCLSAEGEWLGHDIRVTS